MLKAQTGATAALYYRVAHKQELNLYLDNQMQTLLCYANKQGLDSFTVYADNGQSGLTLDRPAFNALKADIEAGRVGKLVIRDVSRLARDYMLTESFIERARKQGVEIISVQDGVLTASPYADASPYAELAALLRSLPKGGGRA